MYSPFGEAAQVRVMAHYALRWLCLRILSRQEDSLLSYVSGRDLDCQLNIIAAKVELDVMRTSASIAIAISRTNTESHFFDIVKLDPGIVTSPVWTA
jgi:hypothetical protein